MSPAVEALRRIWDLGRRGKIVLQDPEEVHGEVPDSDVPEEVIVKAGRLGELEAWAKKHKKAVAVTGVFATGAVVAIVAREVYVRHLKKEKKNKGSGEAE